MRYLLFTVALVASCGEGHQNLQSDMAAVTVIDMAEPAPVDMARPIDPDMAKPPACSSPTPGVYADQLQFNYAPLSNPTQVAMTVTNTTTIVRNDGTIIRPSPAIANPSEYHCDFTEKSVDSTTCMAPCCAGQVGTPVFYFDDKGWTLVVSGVCTFQTTSAVSYSATITFGNGVLVH